MTSRLIAAALVALALIIGTPAAASAPPAPEGAWGSFHHDALLDTSQVTEGETCHPYYYEPNDTMYCFTDAELNERN